MVAVAGLAVAGASAGYGMSQGQADYSGDAVAAANQRNRAISDGTTAINNAFAGFTPDFYKGVSQNYTDFATPQLAQQYNQTKNQIGFDLANRGLNDSGAANTSWGNLADSMNTAKQSIVDTGIGKAQDLQSSVESAKNTQFQNLYASADPSNAGAQAIQTASNFAAPSTFAPLTDMFNGLVNQYYSSKLINSYSPVSAGAAGSYGALPTGGDNQGLGSTTISRGGN